MSYSAIIEYILALTKIYFTSGKKEKSRLLDHATQITGLHRKSITRVLGKGKNSLVNNKKKHCGAKVIYPEELLLPHLKYLWIMMERISAKRMKSALKDWIPFYHENNITSHEKYLIEKMSVSTLERFLKKIKVNSTTGKGITSTSPARHMKNKVPINTLDSNITTPGHVQADTVAHCGDKLIGEFMNSITLTDIHSTWTQNHAIFTKTGNEVKEALRAMEKELPFPLIAINTDSGSEFLNVPVFNHFRGKKVLFTRSRPYKKNDNCYVEQKNFTHVRELFGYQRIELESLKDLMNEIYQRYWNPLQNYFLPTFKIKDKVRIGARIRKIYDNPITPYQRLMLSSSVSDEQKKKLSDNKKKFNPFLLKQELEKKLSIFFIKLEDYNKTKRQIV